MHTQSNQLPAASAADTSLASAHTEGVAADAARRLQQSILLQKQLSVGAGKRPVVIFSDFNHNNHSATPDDGGFFFYDPESKEGAPIFQIERHDHSANPVRD